MVEELKVVIDKLISYTEDQNNVSLCFEKPTHEIHTRVRMAISKYQDGERDRRLWNSLVNDMEAEENPLLMRYHDLQMKLDELGQVSSKAKDALAKIKELKDSGQYNSNDLLKSLDLLNKICEVIILPRIQTIRATYPGVISQASNSSMILGVMLLEKQVTSLMEMIPKNEEDLSATQKTEYFFEYGTAVFVKFEETLPNCKETTSSWEVQVSRSHAKAIELISQIAKGI